MTLNWLEIRSDVATAAAKIDFETVNSTYPCATRSAEAVGVILLAYETCRHVPPE
jgi:hypothetical protein